MSSLAYSNADLVPSAAAEAKPKSKPFWRSVYDSIIASRTRRAEREIAAYIESHGGLLTDDMEREIMRRMTGRSPSLTR